jgi:hypothetical protein
MSYSRQTPTAAYQSSGPYYFFIHIIICKKFQAALITHNSLKVLYVHVCWFLFSMQSGL